MKKLVFSATLILVAMCFASCGDKKDDGRELKISAQVTNSDQANSEVDEVRAVGYIFGVETPVDYDGDGVTDWYDYDEEEVIIASAPFKNGGFTITLPKKVDERLLEPMEFDDMEGINVSDKNAKGMEEITLEAYKDNENVGVFECGYEDLTQYVQVVYMFVDRDVKLTGSYTETDGWIFTITYDLDLKKGWNTVYGIEIEEGGGTATTKKPDVNLTWNYYTYSGNLYKPNAVKKSSKKLLSRLFSK
jgi:hypothetical protein